MKQIKIMVSIVAVITGCITLSMSVAAEEITIVGTGSGMSVLKTVGKAFTLKNPEIRIVIPDSIGSGGGIKTVGNDQYKIGRIARKIKEKEKYYNLTYIPFCKMPIVFFINKSVGIADLTTAQICDIYSGKITNWQAVGGKNAKIRVIRREDGDSSLRILLEFFPGFADIAQTSKSKTTFSDPSTCQLTERKAHSIAYGTYINARNYDVDILAINGKKPTAANYPYIGTLAFVFKKKEFKGDVKKFVKFATSVNAHETIKRSGGIPIF